MKLGLEAYLFTLSVHPFPIVLGNRTASNLKHNDKGDLWIRAGWVIQMRLDKLLYS
jgi:hypothetical protein